jgi:hypothetical protein
MNPDFLCSLVESTSLVRLSVKKAAYADVSRAAYRKYGVILGEGFERRTSPVGTAENYPGCNPGVLLPPKWTIRDSGKPTQDHVLGNFQPSLRDSTSRGSFPTDSLAPALFLCQLSVNVTLKDEYG